MTNSSFVLDTNAVIFLSIIDITSDVKKETIAIRRNTKLKLPDSIVAASAIVQNAVLLTADIQLLRLLLPKLNVRNLI